MPKKSVVRGVAPALGGSVPQAGRAERESDRRRTLAARSRAHDDRDSAQVRSVASGGFIKGKSAIHLARVYGERKKNFVGQNFWARGYWVSTVGRDETVIRDYIRNQEQEDQRLDQMNLWR
jgi:putative transposase